MEEMTLDEQLFYAKDAAYILYQNGSDRHADAILQLLETVRNMQIQMSEMEMKKS